MRTNFFNPSDISVKDALKLEIQETLFVYFAEFDSLSISSVNNNYNKLNNNNALNILYVSFAHKNKIIYKYKGRLHFIISI